MHATSRWRRLRALSTLVLVVAAPFTSPPLHAQDAQGASNAAAPTVRSGALTLVDPGAAPRRTLRMAIPDGAVETQTMRQQMRMEMSAEGMELPAQALPATRVTSRIAVRERTADGAAVLESEVLAADVDTAGANPQLAGMIGAQLAAMRGTRMRYAVQPNGRLSQVSIDGDAGNPLVTGQAQEIARTLEQASIPFPDEPVGVGARWTSGQAVSLNGLTIDQTTEYTVTALDDAQVTLDIRLTQSAKEMRMDAPGMPPGAAVTLRSLDGTGSGTSVIRFGGLHRTIDLRMTTRMVLDMAMGGESRTMNQSMTVTMSMAPAPKHDAP